MSVRSRLNVLLSRRTSTTSQESALPSTSPTSASRRKDTPSSSLFTRKKSSAGLGTSFSDPVAKSEEKAAEVTSTNPLEEQPVSKHTNDFRDISSSPLLTIEVESPTPEATPPTERPEPIVKEDTRPHPLSLLTSDSPSPTQAALIPVPEQPLEASPPALEYNASQTNTSENYIGSVVSETTGVMTKRKIWIKRAGASPTLVQIAQDDLVDDVRDMVLRKYANSLGRSFDAPDVTIKVIPRERSQAERSLGPEEPMCNIIDAYFPGGQHIEEALLIDVPRRRTPLPSPRIMNYNTTYFDDNRPVESGTGYFPPMPASSPHPSQSNVSHDSRHSLHQDGHPHSISVVETGQLPVLPSPRERRGHRPKISRHHTSSPGIIAPSGLVLDKNAMLASKHQGRVESDPRRPNPTSAPKIPTPPAQDVPSKTISAKASTPPVDRIGSPRLTKGKTPRKATVVNVQQQQPQEQNEGPTERKDSNGPQLALSLIDATVPPINVLIVEDNPINLRLLEMFTKRLKVRWQTAMNGRDAVVRWRTGGFHLVLMDIQLPIMSGLEATKEIRRLERVNGIGVFAKSVEEDDAQLLNNPGEGVESNGTEAKKEDDELPDKALFKSPVIIVALTASSLQSDRHEALAAGCNDFLTKPVHFPWLERKVMEWGCMQALIDFDGWRKWKDLAAATEEEKKKEEDLDPALKAKREKKEAKRAALLSKMGQG